MRAKELISKIPGITADQLHNWERQGYLGPKRVSLGKKRVRDYSEEEFALIKAMWSLYQKGVSPKNAYGQATQEISKKMPFLASPVSPKDESTREEAVNQVVNQERNAIMVKLRGDEVALAIPKTLIQDLLNMLATGKAWEVNLKIKLEK